MSDEFKEILEVLEDMVLQHCESNGVISCGFISANFDAIKMLSKYGIVMVIKSDPSIEAEHIPRNER